MILLLEKQMAPLVDKMSQWAEKKSDVFSPFLIRNLRQSVRSRTTLIVFALLVLISAIVAFAGYFEQYDSSRYSRQGYTYFCIFYAFLNVVCFIAIPLFLGGSLRQERLLKQDEQIRITTLTPAKIIRGFLASGCAMMFLIYGAMTPFLMYTYLLRGIDQIAIVASLIVTMAVSLLMFCISLALVGLITKDRAKLNPLALPTFIGIMAAWMVTLLMASGAREISAGVRDPVFWGAVIFTASLYLGQVFLWFAMAISGFEEEEANTSTRVRWALIVNFLTLIGWALFFMFSKSTWPGGGVISSMLGSISFDVILVLSLCLWAMGALLFTTENRILTRRQKESVKKFSRLGRLFAPITLPGGGRGFLLLICGLGITALLLPFCNKYSRPGALVAMAMILGFICLPAQLYWLAFPKNYTAKKARILIVLGNFIWGILSSLFAATFYSYRSRHDNIFVALNPIMAIAEAHRSTLVTVIAFMVTVICAALYITEVTRSLGETRKFLKESKK